ncbi:hypothetical protein [Clostridium paraputrificum]|uniref:hypothetical protein n=1 Tax=Clostridium paraputrificum TaxID=29363 RepID=UPI0006BECC3B|nr:hypothetical protein [Clostridium paraputrificum]CUO20844.1 Uncharacterised protein [Clostridium paraputrificum]
MNNILDDITTYIDSLGNECDWFYNFSKQFFEEELKRELNSTHFLYNKDFKAILKSECNDDVIYYIKDGSFIVVHLTYQKENAINYPRYKIIDNIVGLKKFIKSKG